jgi:hypothetical protein
MGVSLLAFGFWLLAYSKKKMYSLKAGQGRCLLNSLFNYYFFTKEIHITRREIRREQARKSIFLTAHLYLT